MKNHHSYFDFYVKMHKCSNIYRLLVIGLILFFLSPQKLSSQTVFYYDMFKGGTTADGYAPAYFGFGSHTLNVNIAPGSTIRKAYLIGSRLGIAPDLTVQLGGNNFTFDNTNEITTGFSSMYGSPSAIHVIEVTSAINPVINNYLLDVPSQVNSTNNRYQGFYLYIAYENLSLDSIYTAIALNQQDMNVSSNLYNITFPDNINVGGDVGVSLFTGYACNNGFDGENVSCNGTPLGTLGGPDPGSGDCGGQVGSYFYQNITLTGLNGDNEDVSTLDHDALFEAQTMIVAPTNSISILFTHNGGGSDNHIYALIFNWGTSSCSTPTANLGPDQNLCPNDTITLSVLPSGSNVLWSTNDTVASIDILSPGQYWVSLTDSCGSNVDTINILPLSLPSVQLENDTTICEGDIVLLSATSPGSSIIWSTGDTTQTISVTNAGSYWITATNSCGASSDTFNLATTALPVAILGADTILCDVSSVLLSSSWPGASNLWSTGDTSNTIIVNNTGTYWVTHSNNCGSDIDSIDLTFYTTPAIDLGNDVSLCGGDSATLSANWPNATYLWSTGSTNQQIIVNNSGSYWVSVSNYCGNDADTVQVNFNASLANLVLPNVMTTDGDGVNDEYIIPLLSEAISFNMEFFDRWGVLLYSTSDYAQPWNGTTMGNPVSEGIYYVVLHYIDCNQNETTKTQFIHIFK